MLHRARRGRSCRPGTCCGCCRRARPGENLGRGRALGVTFRLAGLRRLCEVGFVGLNGLAAPPSGPASARRHRHPNPMRHEPCRLVVPPSMRWSWCVLMPFLLLHIRYVACSHLVSGILERSKTVPTVTVNCLRHSLHLRRPGRVNVGLWSLHKLQGPRLFTAPQCGQTGPFGQKTASRASRASSASVNCGAVRSGHRFPLRWPLLLTGGLGAYFVKYIIAILLRIIYIM